ncbi:MAG: 4Fe-4S dicluster domain-containing protein [Chitinispirillia bacterium]
MENNRRKFLKIAGITTLGLGIGVRTLPAGQHTQSAIGSHKKKPGGKRYGMVIDTRRFQGPDDLNPMIEACDKIHNIPHHSKKNHEIKWIWKEHYHNVFTDLKNAYLAESVDQRPIPALCNHCDNPPCVRPCPTHATFQRDDGIVFMDFHRCIGCRCCMAGCPYGARSFNYIDPRPAIDESDFNRKFPTRMKGVVEKCNFCAERLAVGKTPACVEASRGAIVFGDLNDSNSVVRRLLSSIFAVRRKASLGTEPSVFYIL